MKVVLNGYNFFLRLKLSRQIALINVTNFNIYSGTMDTYIHTLNCYKKIRKKLVGIKMVSGR